MTHSIIVANHIDSECWCRQTLFTINIRYSFFRFTPSEPYTCLRKSHRSCRTPHKTTARFKGRCV